MSSSDDEQERLKQNVRNATLNLTSGNRELTLLEKEKHFAEANKAKAKQAAASTAAAKDVKAVSSSDEDEFNMIDSSD